MELNKQLETMMNFQHISYEEKISRAYEELINTDPNTVIKRLRSEWDNLLGGIYGGKIYLVGADTGIGKSTFVNQVAKNVSDQGWKVVKYSLEDRMEDIGKEEIFYECNKIRIAQGFETYKRVKFVNNEYGYDNEEEAKTYVETVTKACANLSKKTIVELDKKKQVNLEELCWLMEEQCNEGAKMFFIDHLHYFEFDGDKQRLDLQIQNVMHQINEIARKRNVAVMIVAHYKANRVKTGEPSYDWFKDGSAIKQVANIIIQLEREENITQFHITKMRGPIKPYVMQTTFNISTFEYDFKKRTPSTDIKQNRM